MTLTPSFQAVNALNPNYAGPVTYSGAITLASAASIGSDGGVLTITGVISGPGDLTKVGTGSVQLQAANTFTGQFTIAAGDVNLNNASGLGTIAGGTTVLGGASLVLYTDNTNYVGELLTLSGQGNGIIGSDNLSAHGPNETTIAQNPINQVQSTGALSFQGAANTTTWTGNILLNPGTVITSLNTNSNASAVFEITGEIGDAPGVHGDLIKGGDGNLALEDAETYTGATTVRFGVLDLENAGSILQTSERRHCQRRPGRCQLEPGGRAAARRLHDQHRPHQRRDSGKPQGGYALAVWQLDARRHLDRTDRLVESDQWHLDGRRAE